MSIDNPAPKGQEDSARGFNPGYSVIARRARKGRQIRCAGQDRGRIDRGGNTGSRRSTATRETLRSRPRRHPRPRIRPRGVTEYWSTAPIRNCTPRPRGCECFQGGAPWFPIPGVKTPG